MSIKSTNNSCLFTEKHYGNWVALSSDRKTIIDYSAELYTLTSKHGTKEVVYTRPLNPSINYAF